MDINKTDSATTDADLIEEEDTFPEAQGSSGGNLARDVASQNELDRVRDPEAQARPEKQDDIDNDTAVKPARGADSNST
ncbi:hypothetical protein [Sphingomonas sp. MS122]|uniref:hypothetical protein n=1 Tax=Sphingomonas sp. MS122 TaxID=3412683 RepID=UPI003C2C4036